MSPALRQYLINELGRGISSIGRDFEPFGTRFVDAAVDSPMQHRGLNIEGQPVGHTVDSISDDGRTAAEYTADNDYFKAPFSKLCSDFKHVRTLHSQAKRILLVSSREAGPKAMTRLTNFCSHIKKRLEIDVEIYDARRIAEYIVDSLLNNDIAVDSLAPYLGPLAKVRDEFAATHLIPELSAGYIQQPKFKFRTFC